MKEVSDFGVEFSVMHVFTGLTARAYIIAPD